MVDLATVHHEGDGRPRDDLAAPGTKGYVLGIGTTRWQFFRPPWLAFATLNFNHRSFDVLFSGDRDVYPVTPTDLRLLAAGAAAGRALGWLVDSPFVRPHRESPGSLTICPGNRAAYPDPPRWPAGDPLTWVGIVTALHKEAPPVPDPNFIAPHFFPPLEIVDMCMFTHPHLGTAIAAIDPTGAVFCTPADAYLGGANGKDYFAGRVAAYIRPRAGGYTISDTHGNPYNYPE